MARVLVVDDEFGIRHIIRLALERINISVLEAADAETALAIVSQLKPDVVITDLRLPTTMSGVELTHRIHAISPRLPVIFISASTELQTAADAARVGTFLEKPFKLHKLQAIIQQTLSCAESC